MTAADPFRRLSAGERGLLRDDKAAEDVVRET
jgi:hypothetical protein